MRIREGRLCRRVLLTVFAFWVAPGCSDSTSITTRCTAPGGEAECTCADATTSFKVCDASNNFGPCMCAGVSTGGEFGSGGFTSTGGFGGASGLTSSGGAFASGGAIGSGGTQTDSGTGNGKKGLTLATGQDSLIDVFVLPAGILVVSEGSITLVDRTGKVLQSKTAPRQITAAAFDGNQLAVFDKAFLDVYTPSLSMGAQASLSEPCAAAAFVSGGRVVCGNTDDFSHVFYVYDTGSGSLLNGASGDPASAYQGVPMRAVPGKDDFVTVPVDSSPANFYLHRVDASSKVSLVGPTPYFDEFAVSMVFAFEGNPADHLITEEGVRLLIYSSTCAPNATSGSQCFSKDGSLGTLRDTQRFIGMDGDGTSIYGLVDDQSAQFSYNHCAMGCWVQKVDTQTRTVTTQTLYDVSPGSVVATRYDATSNALVVGYDNPTDVGTTTGQSPGYRVELLAF